CVRGTTARHEHVHNTAEKAVAVDRAIEQPWRLDPVVPQSGDEGHRVPVTIRGFAWQAFAKPRPSPQRRYVCLGPRLVDENQPGRVNPLLIYAPEPAPPRDIGSILFAGDDGFFKAENPRVDP